jgi:hypothetical protein
MAPELRQNVTEHTYGDEVVGVVFAPVSSRCERALVVTGVEVGSDERESVGPLSGLVADLLLERGDARARLLLAAGGRFAGDLNQAWPLAGGRQRGSWREEV